MRLLPVFIAAGLMVGCAYVTRAEYDQYWDFDQDGWPLDQDCDDDNPEFYPYAADIRGDGCDSDCLLTQTDADGDDWPDSSDCNPEDPNVYPCAEDAPGDGVDADCDGNDDPRTDVCPTADPDYPEVTSIAGCDGASSEEEEGQ